MLCPSDTSSEDRENMSEKDFSFSHHSSSKSRELGVSSSPQTAMLKSSVDNKENLSENSNESDTTSSRDELSSHGLRRPLVDSIGQKLDRTKSGPSNVSVRHRKEPMGSELQDDDYNFLAYKFQKYGQVCDDSSKKKDHKSSCTSPMGSTSSSEDRNPHMRDSAVSSIRPPLIGQSADSANSAIFRQSMSNTSSYFSSNISDYQDSLSCKVERLIGHKVLVQKGRSSRTGISSALINDVVNSTKSNVLVTRSGPTRSISSSSARSETHELATSSAKLTSDMHQTLASSLSQKSLQVSREAEESSVRSLTPNSERSFRRPTTSLQTKADKWSSESVQEKFKDSPLETKGVAAVSDDRNIRVNSKRPSSYHTSHNDQFSDSYLVAHKLITQPTEAQALAELSSDDDFSFFRRNNSDPELRNIERHLSGTSVVENPLPASTDKNDILPFLQNKPSLVEASGSRILEDTTVNRQLSLSSEGSDTYESIAKSDMHSKNMKFYVVETAQDSTSDPHEPSANTNRYLYLRPIDSGDLIFRNKNAKASTPSYAVDEGNQSDFLAHPSNYNFPENQNCKEYTLSREDNCFVSDASGIRYQYMNEPSVLIIDPCYGNNDEASSGKLVYLEDSNFEQLISNEEEIPQLRWYPYNISDSQQDIRDAATQTAVSYLAEQQLLDSSSWLDIDSHDVHLQLVEPSGEEYNLVVDTTVPFEDLLKFQQEKNTVGTITNEKCNIDNSPRGLSSLKHISEVHPTLESYGNQRIRPRVKSSSVGVQEAQSTALFGHHRAETITFNGKTESLNQLFDSALDESVLSFDPLVPSTSFSMNLNRSNSSLAQDKNMSQRRHNGTKTSSLKANEPILKHLEKVCTSRMDDSPTPSMSVPSMPKFHSVPPLKSSSAGRDDLLHDIFIADSEKSGVSTSSDNSNRETSRSHKIAGTLEAIGKSKELVTHKENSLRSDCHAQHVASCSCSCSYCAKIRQTTSSRSHSVADSFPPYPAPEASRLSTHVQKKDNAKETRTVFPSTSTVTEPSHFSVLTENNVMKMQMNESLLNEPKLSEISDEVILAHTVRQRHAKDATRLEQKANGKRHSPKKQSSRRKNAFVRGKNYYIAEKVGICDGVPLFTFIPCSPSHTPESKTNSDSDQQGFAKERGAVLTQKFHDSALPGKAFIDEDTSNDDHLQTIPKSKFILEPLDPDMPKASSSKSVDVFRLSSNDGSLERTSGSIDTTGADGSSTLKSSFSANDMLISIEAATNVESNKQASQSAESISPASYLNCLERIIQRQRERYKKHLRYKQGNKELLDDVKNIHERMTHSIDQAVRVPSVQPKIKSTIKLIDLSSESEKNSEVDRKNSKLAPKHSTSNHASHKAMRKLELKKSNNNISSSTDSLGNAHKSDAGKLPKTVSTQTSDSVLNMEAPNSYFNQKKNGLGLVGSASEKNVQRSNRNSVLLKRILKETGRGGSVSWSIPLKTRKTAHRVVKQPESLQEAFMQNCAQVAINVETRKNLVHELREIRHSLLLANIDTGAQGFGKFLSVKDANKARKMHAPGLSPQLKSVNLPICQTKTYQMVQRRNMEVCLKKLHQLSFRKKSMKSNRKPTSKNTTASFRIRSKVFSRNLKDGAINGHVNWKRTELVAEN